MGVLLTLDYNPPLLFLIFSKLVLSTMKKEMKEEENKATMLEVDTVMDMVNSNLEKFSSIKLLKLLNLSWVSEISFRGGKKFIIPLHTYITKLMIKKTFSFI